MSIGSDCGPETDLPSEWWQAWISDNSGGIPFNVVLPPAKAYSQHILNL